MHVLQVAGAVHEDHGGFGRVRLWRNIEPGGYADEHITHYTYKGLVRYFASRGYVHEATRYILRGELILAFRKPRV